MFSAALYARVHFPLCQSHTRSRVQRASGIPCALCFERAGVQQQTSVASRREIADTYSVVVTRPSAQLRTGGG
jgi:hypothetical protein